MPIDTVERISPRLECLVDDYGLPNVLEALEVICEEKADFARDNWQDYEMEEGWRSAGEAIAQALATL
ncbi:hypothetical protein CMI37_27205 [Candidatus Pacearchaeota archaeon]|nr:hypothetical protein [Candidatus Pacearchaeota archaeon]|tara:strand:+ start:3938 stop:4141 length:204 start_codon:yes stop_codon:yes gene_type:complete